MLLHSQAFWLSRFRYENRELLFDSGLSISDLQFRPRSLAKLYRMTSSRSIGPALRNRKRVKVLVGILCKLLESKMQPVSDLPELDAVAWLHVSDRQTRKREDRIPECNHTRVRLPECIDSVHVSCLDFGPMTYITGIRFVGKGLEEEKRIGWIADSSQEKTYKSQGELLGFRLALSSWGIRALQVVGSRGGGGGTRVVRGVEADSVADGGGRVVVVRGSTPDGFDGLGLVVDGSLEETALAVCWWCLKGRRRRC